MFWESKHQRDLFRQIVEEYTKILILIFDDFLH